MADLEVQPVRAIQAPRVFHPGADDKGGYWEDFGLTMAFDFSEASGSLVAVVTKTDGPTRLFAFDLTSGAVRWQEIITSNSNANIHAVALSPDGRLVLVPTDADSQITLWNADIGSLLDRKPTDGTAGDVDWHPAGALLAVVAGKGVEIWEVTGNILERQRTINASRTEGEWPLAVRWSPDGAYLAIGTNDPAVYISKSDGSTQSPGLTPQPSGSVSMTEWSPAGDCLAAATPGTGSTILIWKDPRMAVDSPFEQKYTLISTITADSGQSLGKLTWDPSGRMLAVGDSTSNLRIYDAPSGSLLKSFPAHPNSEVTEAHWKGDQLITVGAYPDKDFRVWRVSNTGITDMAIDLIALRRQIKEA